MILKVTNSISRTERILMAEQVENRERVGDYM